MLLALFATCFYADASVAVPASVVPHMDETVRRLGLQTDMPGGEKEMEAEDSKPWGLRFSGFSPRVASFLLYSALAMILVILLAHLKFSPWSASRSRRFTSGRDDGTSGASSARSERMRRAGARADDLAAAGDFAGAMHLILIESVGELRNRLATPIAASLTSREILERAPLSQEERSALADIVSGVEISYFGAYRPGAEEYAACRHSFESLKGLLMRGRA
jgi:hypothetical protein